MEQDTETTVVVFRKYPPKEGGDALALFPLMDEGRRLCGSYQHVGQHGVADYFVCIHSTQPATPSEYAALAEELESIGYRLDIRKRCPNWRRVAASRKESASCKP